MAYEATTVSKNRMIFHARAMLARTILSHSIQLLFFFPFTFLLIEFYSETFCYFFLYISFFFSLISKIPRVCQFFHFIVTKIFRFMIFLTLDFFFHHESNKRKKILSNKNLSELNIKKLSSFFFFF